MDALFKRHDQGDLSNQRLVEELKTLPNTGSRNWGFIYVAHPSGAPDSVCVSGLSFIGGKTFFLWRPMAYTEYARREALAGMSLVSGINFGR